MNTLLTEGATLLVGLISCQVLMAESHEYITTRKPTVLLSVNDGESNSWDTSEGKPALTNDSITVIHLFRDQPPRVKTVYGTTRSAIWGAPYAAIVGRFGIVTNHDYRMGETVAREITGTNQILSIDLESSELTVTSQIDTDSQPWLALGHPDGERVIVALSDYWLVLKLDQDGNLLELARSPSPNVVYSFDASNDGRTILATAANDRDLASSDTGIFRYSIHDDNSISLDTEITSEKFQIDGPFAPRISPNGQYALVLNSLGASDGVLDDVLVIDLDSNSVSQVIAQVGDGLESLAFHPSGDFAVVAVLNYFGPIMTSHLAVIDFANNVARTLYHLPVEQVPEGIEFTSDGTKLFVGSTQANHISVYDIDGKKLVASPYVLPTGNGHSLLGIRSD